MSKPRFSRNYSDGYDAYYKVDESVFTAVFSKSGRKWKISDGFGMGTEGVGKEWAKLGDLKKAWAALCANRGPVVTKSADTASVTPAPASPPVGPPSLSGPPKLGPPAMSPPSLGGPPKLGPPSIAPPAIKPPAPAPVESEAVPGKTTASSSDQSLPTRGEQSATTVDGAVLRGEAANDPITPENFELFLKQQGKLLGKVSSNGTKDFLCEACGRHVTDWARDPDGVIRPPCRCCTPVHPGEYVADSLDPRMWGKTLDGSMRTISPVGALDQVYYWMRCNTQHCSADGILVEPFASVQKVLWNLTGYAEYRPDKWGKRGREADHGPIHE